MEKSIQIAYKLGKTAHNGQKRTGSNSPYFQHCKNVFKIVSSLKNKEDINLTDMQIMALLHDTIEDTQVTREEIEKIFGFKIADGVWALTKNSELSHIDALKNSLDKIKEYGKEAAIVKLADRIDNLKELNPEWNKKTALAYAESSKLIDRKSTRLNSSHAT